MVKVPSAIKLGADVDHTDIDRYLVCRCFMYRGQELPEVPLMDLLVRNFETFFQTGR